MPDRFTIPFACYHCGGLTAKNFMFPKFPAGMRVSCSHKCEFCNGPLEVVFDSVGEMMATAVIVPAKEGSRTMHA